MKIRMITGMLLGLFAAEARAEYSPAYRSFGAASAENRLHACAMWMVDYGIRMSLAAGVTATTSEPLAAVQGANSGLYKLMGYSLTLYLIERDKPGLIRSWTTLRRNPLAPAEATDLLIYCSTAYTNEYARTPALKALHEKTSAETDIPTPVLEVLATTFPSKTR